MNRRNFIKITAAAAVAVAGRPAFAAEDATKMTVYKDPNCGCCELWADAMAKAGYAVEIVKERDLIAVKKRLGVPLDIQSCHTAVHRGKYLEGHVPLKAVRMLESRIDLAGLVVPGMPAGSLGMGDGSVSVLRRHRRRKRRQDVGVLGGAAQNLSVSCRETRLVSAEPAVWIAASRRRALDAPGGRRHAHSSRRSRKWATASETMRPTHQRPYAGPNSLPRNHSKPLRGRS